MNGEVATDHHRNTRSHTQSSWPGAQSGNCTDLRATRNARPNSPFIFRKPLRGRCL